MDVKLLTPDDVAARLQVAPKTVREWLKQGKIIGFKLGPRLWRIKEEDFQDFIKKGVLK